MEATARSGDLRLGSLEIGERIGSGAFGEVRRARHCMTGEMLAVKFIDPRLASDAEFRKTFRKEVNAVAAMAHPNIVAVHAYGELTKEQAEAIEFPLGTPWYAMEYAPRCLVFDEVRDWLTLRRILGELLSGLAHAHARGVVHRDLKPDNFLMIPTENGERLALTDFGLAHTVGVTATQDVFGPLGGTALYMSPEQFRGDWRSFGPWTDLYSLGCVAYELAGDVPLFGATDPMGVAMQRLTADMPNVTPKFAVPEAFVPWLSRLVRQLPRDRFTCAADAIYGLTIVDKSPMVAPDKPPIDLVFKPRRRVPVNWRSVLPQAGFRPQGEGLLGVRTSSFVGRDAERDVIWEELRKTARDGKNRAVVLRGPAGSGTSRLAEWISQRAVELGAAKLLSASFTRTAEPSSGLRAMLTRELGIGTEKDRGAATRLRARFSEDYPAERVISFVRSAESMRASSSPMDRILTFRHVIRALSRDRPVILLLDDLQQASGGLFFLDQLLEVSDRLLVIATVTENEGTTSYLEEVLEKSTVVAIDRMEDDELAEVVRSLLPADERLTQAIVERAEGSPLFVEQLLAGWIADGSLEPHAGGYRAVGRLDPPEDVHAVWRDRIATLQLDESAERCVAIAAMVGRTITGRGWADACALAGVDPTNAHQSLVAAGLLVPSDYDSWKFAHGLLWESLLKDAERRDDWAENHRICAESLDRLHGARSIEGQASHLICAKDWDRAFDLLADLASLSFRRQDLSKCTALAKRMRLVLDSASIEASEERWGRVRAIEFEVLLTGGELATASELGDTLVQNAREFGWQRIEARTLVLVATLAEQTGRPVEEAEALLTDAEAIFAALEDRSGVAWTIRARAALAARAGRPVEAVELGVKALTVFDKVGNVEGQTASLITIAFAASSGRVYDQAKTWFRRAHKSAVEHGFRYSEAEALNGLGEVERRLDRIDKARRCFGEAETIWSELGSSLELRAQTNLAFLLLREEKWLEARQQLGAIRRRAEETNPTLVDHAIAGLVFCDAADAQDERFDAQVARLKASPVLLDREVRQIIFRAAKAWLDHGDKQKALVLRGLVARVSMAVVESD